MRHHLAAAVLLTAAGLLAACVPAREILFPTIGLSAPALRQFPSDFAVPLSSETGKPMAGFGGSDWGSKDHVPVIFIHGNTVSARFWLPARQHFLAAGYGPAQLWAPGYGWDNVHYFDSADLSVPGINQFVTQVLAYLSQQRGTQVQQVDVVAHSIGVTVVRQWLLQTNSFHKVRNFVAACGANHGVWTAELATRGQQRGVSWELAAGSPWLAQLNRNGETPGPTRYLTLYDGTGRSDVLFPPPGQDSSVLAGATNLAYNREKSTHFDHLELPRQAETLDTMLRFFEASPLPINQAAPVLVRSGNRVYANQPGARVYCAAGGKYPTQATAGQSEFTLGSSPPYTCYARHLRSQQASPLARYAADDGQPSAVPTLSANLASGAYAQAQFLSLSSSNPAAFITYTTSGTAPNSGSALYSATQPIYLSGPVRLQAIATTPDGQTSAPLVLDIDISLEKEEAENTLQRQLDARTPERYAGQRRKGR